VNQNNLENAIRWCIDNNQISLIHIVKVLLYQKRWEVFYEEKSFRYYSKWPFCLTNIPSGLRRLLLEGTDYDLTNAIGQFVMESTKNNGLDDFPLAKEYLMFPKKTRLDLISVLGVSNIQAKKILHASLNGACRIPSSISNGVSSLTSIVDIPTSLMFVEHFKDLLKELSKLRRKIATNNKDFMMKYFEWEKKQIQQIFGGTGLIMHDGIDGCCSLTSIPNFIEITTADIREQWK
jgi:hypothetical protein